LLLQSGVTTTPRRVNATPQKSYWYHQKDEYNYSEVSGKRTPGVGRKTGQDRGF